MAINAIRATSNAIIQDVITEQGGAHAAIAAVHRQNALTVLIKIARSASAGTHQPAADPVLAPVTIRFHGFSGANRAQ
jgi:hypothetical protein